MAEPEILKFDGEPILVPTGPLTDDMRTRIEKSAAGMLREGSKLAILALLDAETGKPLKGKFGVAVRAGDHLTFTVEGQKTFGGKSSGFVGFIAEF